MQGKRESVGKHRERGDDSLWDSVHLELIWVDLSVDSHFSNHSISFDMSRHGLTYQNRIFPDCYLRQSDGGIRTARFLIASPCRTSHVPFKNCTFRLQNLFFLVIS